MKSFAWDFTCVFSIPVKFEIYFLGLLQEIVFSYLLLQITKILHLKPLKSVKKNVIQLQIIIPVQGFCPLKIKILLLNFLMDSVLSYLIVN